MLLNRLAAWFGFRKKDGVFISLVLTAEVMLLPLALRYNLVLWWLGITALTTILPAYWFTKRLPILSKRPMKVEEQEFETRADSVTIVESETITETSQTTAEPEPLAVPGPEITLEDLIDCGFAAKNSGRFQSAAEWFTRALSLHPEPDLAFYLMMDACSLWLTVHKRDQAQELLRHYWPEYERLFAHEQRTQLSGWLSKENLLG